MGYQGVLLAVSDLEQAKAFYQQVLGMKITADFGENVTLDGQVYLQSRKSWQTLIRREPVQGPYTGGELYFEREDLDSLLAQLQALDVPLVHPLTEHRWGQRVIRFFDPDGHIIEVGEPIAAVARRFSAQGLSLPQVAARMDVTEEQAAAWLGGCHKQ